MFYYHTIILLILGNKLGPLTVTNNDGSATLVGVTSWGFGCGNAQSPGVFARVSTVLDWIHTYMEDNGGCE